MTDNPLFWVTAIISVLITGVSKGGFGGIAILAVPLMALTISPVVAAGIMLPILLVMDAFSLWAWRGSWRLEYLLFMLPGAVIGVSIGAFFAGEVNDDFVRIVVGIVAVSFACYAILGTLGSRTLRAFGKPAGVLASVTAGFTSFVAHAGAPPFQAYMIPQGLSKKNYTGTSVAFFAFLNTIKIFPYAYLGQLSVPNLTTSALLVPLAPLGVWLGIWLNGKVEQGRFYQILYAIVLIVGLKLLGDGVLALSRNG